MNAYHRSTHRLWLAIVLMCQGATAASTWAQDDVARVLKAQTQELLNAVTNGDPRVWDRHLDPQVLYLAEDGTRKSKTDLLKEITPLPKGISGTITVSDFEMRRHGDTAIATHNDLEDEDYFGHKIKAEYRTTDTWLRTAQGWKLIASQVHAQLIDPPAIQLAPAKLDEYAGTFSLNADITYSIRRQGNALTGERTGRPTQMLSVEAPDVLFVPGQPRSRKVFLRSADGRVTGFVDRREGRDIPWRKIR